MLCFSHLQIAGEMANRGFPGVTGRLCEIKFKNMKARYKIIKTRQRETGTEGGSRWQYYDLMDDLLRNDLAVNPNNVAEVGAAGFNRIQREPVNIQPKCLCFFFVSEFEDSKIFVASFPIEDEDDEDGAPVRKRKRISNAETIELMMKSEAERQKVNTEMLEILNGFRQQGEEKINLLKLIVDDGKCSRANWID